MNGPAVLAAVSTIVALLLAAYLIGTGELDDIIMRWEQDRRDRESMRRQKAATDELRSSFPRVLR